ncbi:MAG: hypothetical protein KAU27_12135, partial [Desulfuromonadales bacterium]|nr:hypothetical protein [Desulfuromonadales bacterium]
VMVGKVSLEIFNLWFYRSWREEKPFFCRGRTCAAGRQKQQGQERSYVEKATPKHSKVLRDF